MDDSLFTDLNSVSFLPIFWAIKFPAFRSDKLLFLVCGSYTVIVDNIMLFFKRLFTFLEEFCEYWNLGFCNLYRLEIDLF